MAGFARDLCVGLLAGWLVSVLLIGLAVVGVDDPSATLQAQLRLAVAQENNGCHRCGGGGGSTGVFRCQLFFECALKLVQAQDANPAAPQLQPTSVLLFDRVDICGASLVGGGLFAVAFAPVDPGRCVPAFTANATVVDRSAVEAMRLLSKWIDTIPVPPVAAPSPPHAPRVAAADPQPDSRVVVDDRQQHGSDPLRPHVPPEQRRSISTTLRTASDYTEWSRAMQAANRLLPQVSA